MGKGKGEHKEQGTLTQARSKRGKCAKCQKRESTMLHWRAYDFGVIPWPDVCEKCWQECDDLARVVRENTRRTRLS